MLSSSSRLVQRLAPALLSAASAAGSCYRQQALSGGAALALSSMSSSSSLSASLRNFSAAIKSPPGGTSEDASVPAADDDTHADFRPAYAPPPSSETVRASIERDVKENDVFVYMKVCFLVFFSFLFPLAPFSTPTSFLRASQNKTKTMQGDPEAPQCGFSNMACRILDAYGVVYGSRNVLADPALRDGVKEFSEWPTIPQVFVKGEFVGGADILMSMHQSGELEKALEGVKK